MTEQRKHHRVPVKFDVTCIAADGTTWEGASVRDISLGGAFVESEREVPFGADVTLLVRGIAARELRLPGVVRWSDASGFGVQFGLLGAYATHVILDIVKKKSA